MTLIPFIDSTILRPRVVDHRVEPRTVSGGATLVGTEQVVGTSAGRRRAVLSGFDQHTSAQVREFRRFREAMCGRANTTLVPFYERGRAPWPVDVYARELNPKFALAAAPDPAGVIDSLIVAAAAGTFAGPAIAVPLQTNLIIEMKDVPFTVGTVPTTFVATAPQAGDIFSIGNFAYTITEVFGVTVLASSKLVSCTFQPGLRTTAPAGTVINFTSPAAEMRFTTDDQGAAPLDQWKFAVGTLEFIEAV